MKRGFISVFALGLLLFSLAVSVATVYAAGLPNPPATNPPTATPDEGTGIAITVVVPRPDVRPVEVITPSQPVVNHIYPIHVWESREDGRREIIRVYELRDGECPSQIPRHSFERDGFRFELAEIVRREIPAHSLREHTEVVTVNTQTNDLATVIRLLSPTLEHMSEDGYFGVLALDVTSIQIESQGTTSSNFTATRTREFPHLSNTDTSLIPRTLTYGGRTYNLANVEWRGQGSTAIDYRQVATSFTAVATYTRVGTRVATIGYTTTAEYSGQVSRIAIGRTEFTAHFIGIPIVSPILTPIPPIVGVSDDGSAGASTTQQEATTPPTGAEGTASDGAGSADASVDADGTSDTSESTSIGVVNVDTVHIGGIVIEVEQPILPEHGADSAGAGDSYNNGNNGTGISDDDADADDSVLVANDEDGGFPLGTVAVVLLFIGGIVFAYFVGKKGKAILSGMKKASCFLLALVLAGGLMLGTAQTAYAADIPRYGFGRRNDQSDQGGGDNQDTNYSQPAIHFNYSSASTGGGDVSSRSGGDAVMHFNPRVATSDGAAVRASPAVHFQHGASAHGFGAGGSGSHGYNYGDRIGTLTVPRLNRRVNVIAGATMSAMDFGAGWFSFTGLNSGNTALIAHNRGSAGFFSFVRLLQEGDIITLEAGGIIRSYAVAMVYYIEETDFSPLMQFGDNRLTLVTCREYHRSQRRVAVAFAVE